MGLLCFLNYEKKIKKKERKYEIVMIVQLNAHTKKSIKSRRYSVEPPKTDQPVVMLT